MKTILKIVLNLIIPVLFLTQNSFGQLWYITRGLSTDEVAWGVDVDSEGNIYWAVEEKDQWPFWYYNILLFKIDSNAQQVWQSNSFGGAYNEVAKDVAMFGDYLYITAETGSYGNGQTLGDHKADGLLLKVNGRTMKTPDSTMTNVTRPLIYEQNPVEFYPNPFSTSTTIWIKSERFINCELIVFDNTGNIVFKRNLKFDSETLNLNLPGGMYFYRVKSDKQIISSGKFIIQ